MRREGSGTRRTGRRRFLVEVCGGAAAVAAAGAAKSSAAPAEEPAREGLPTIRLGKFEVTRLISGGNPIEGYAHSTENMRRHMLEYFTLERTVEYLERLVSAGINTWQFDFFPKPAQALKAVREKGVKLQFICLHHEGRSPVKTAVEAMQPIAVVHHGGVTDRLFREGKAGEVRDFVKKVHDAGCLAGVSTHRPENLRRIQDEGWENDFYMACFYQVSRTREEQLQAFGTAAVHEPFFEGEPVAMTKVIREIPKPCLAFKILAAGRLCQSQAEVEEAFRFALANIKKTDAVIVGMYPRFEDEIRLNVGYARKYG